MKRIRALSVLLPWLAAGTCVAADESALRDSLGRAWRNECVTFPVNKALLAKVRAGRVLVGPEGRPAPHRVIPGERGGARFRLRADEPAILVAEGPSSRPARGQTPAAVVYTLPSAPPCKEQT